MRKVIGREVLTMVAQILVDVLLAPESAHQVPGVEAPLDILGLRPLLARLALLHRSSGV